MLKKFFVVFMIIFVAASFVLPSFAANKERVTAKINRGGEKIISSPLEIPKAIMQTTKESNPVFGLLFGSIRGACNFVAKITSGVVDVVGCNVGDTKVEYVKPQMTAEPKK